MAKSKKKTLTRLQLEKILLTPCKTEQDLKNFIKYFLKLELPDCKVSRYSDTDPFHAVWEVYDICVNKNNPQKIKELLYVAGRGSGKCSVQGTKITTQFGPKNIENIKLGDIVWTGWNWQPVVETFDEGIKNGVTITTKKGKKDSSYTMTGSLKHRIQAFDDVSRKIDWVYMKDLKPNQIIYKSAERVYDAVVDITSEDYEKGWLIGNIVGDGCVSRHGNNISVCATDEKQIAFYCDTVKKYFDIIPDIKSSNRDATRDISISSKNFRTWFESFIEGELCYFKKLKTLEHSPSFLAGFIAGMMETDGSKDSITLANKELIYQIAQILTLFGVHSVIDNNRRPNSTTKFIPSYIVTYHMAVFNNLPDYMMPLFSKRQSFINFRQKQNEQFRYPSVLIKTFADYIKSKYKIAGGYWNISSKRGKRSHSNIKYSKDLWGVGKKSKESYIYGYKIDYYIELARKLNEDKWVEYLSFIRNGYYEVVNTVTFGDYYFYDMEVAVDHAYVSNGFVSHNSLGMAIAELTILLHDQRDVVHVGAIMNQAKRVYAYQQKFLLNDRIKPIVMPSDIPEDQRILEKANMEKSTFNINGEKPTIEVLPCTLKSCPTIDQIVMTNNGEFLAGDIKIGDKLKSPLGNVEVLDNKIIEKECIQVELEDGTIVKGTLDHKIMTTIGWVELQNLTEEHDVIINDTNK